MAKKKKTVRRTAPPIPDVVKYQSDYSDSGFWDKLKRFAKKAGRELVEKALILYYGLQCPKTPAKAKAVIVGALGYFILPLDLIPDVIPGIGFTDDLAVLAAALVTVMATLCKEDIERGKQKAGEWFGA